MSRNNYFNSGDWNAVCFECGRKKKASELKKHWQGYYVCKEHWEPRHPQDFVRGIPDVVTPVWTQPMPVDVFVSGNYSLSFGDNTSYTESTVNDLAYSISVSLSDSKSYSENFTKYDGLAAYDDKLAYSESVSAKRNISISINDSIDPYFESINKQINTSFTLMVSDSKPAFIDSSIPGQSAVDDNTVNSIEVNGGSYTSGGGQIFLLTRPSSLSDTKNAYTESVTPVKRSVYTKSLSDSLSLSETFSKVLTSYSKTMNSSQVNKSSVN